MKDKILIGVSIILLALNFVSAMQIDFYYSPSCPHCQNVIPTIQSLMLKYKSPDYIWKIFDTSQPASYDIKGVPTIKIKTNDCRNIVLSGDVEINRWLKCELQEMSSYECPTYTKLNPKTNSYFIR